MNSTAVVLWYSGEGGNSTIPEELQQYLRCDRNYTTTGADGDESLPVVFYVPEHRTKCIARRIPTAVPNPNNEWTRPMRNDGRRGIRHAQEWGDTFCALISALITATAAAVHTFELHPAKQLQHCWPRNESRPQEEKEEGKEDGFIYTAATGSQRATLDLGEYGVKIDHYSLEAFVGFCCTRTPFLISPFCPIHPSFTRSDF